MPIRTKAHGGMLQGSKLRIRIQSPSTAKPSTKRKEQRDAGRGTYYSFKLQDQVFVGTDCRTVADRRDRGLVERRKLAR